MRHNLNLRRLAACVALLTGLAQAASATEILIGDAKSSPESMTVAPDGTVIAGSGSSPFIYRVRPGSTNAEKFVDASSEPAGTYFFGVLADGATNTLWACQLTTVAGTSPARHQSVVRGFDLATGAPKLRWNLPGDDSVCNDIAIGPDKALYITDTASSKIYKLPAGASTADLYLQARTFLGVDGITFLDGVLYVNNVYFSKLFRIPVDASGKPGQPVDIWMDQPVKGPDGMRAANGKLYIAENALGQSGAGRIIALTIDGDKAHVTVLKDGLKVSTGIEPAGDTVWFTQRGNGTVTSLPLPK